MVEFKVKTLATKDTTLHATYPDLYDGTSPYLKVGGDDEPKKSLVRFPIADKPSYGAAELKGGEVGFYTTGLSSSQGSFPTFNIYKLKTGPNDSSAWSGDGRIRTVPRGKQVVGITVTNVVNSVETGSYVTVLNHQINTGDRLYHSPYTLQFGDVKISIVDTVTAIMPDLEYYAIRVDRDNIAFATSIANALAGTRITLAAYSNYNYIPVGNSDGTFTGLTGPWGYVRAETYKQDIHVVTAKPKGSETISENFDGSAYREGDLSFETIQRNIVRKTNPHVKNGSSLWDKPEGTTRAQGEEGAWREEADANLEAWYGEKQAGDGYKIYLTDYESKSDGRGWWETEKDAGKWKGGYEYVPKTSPPTSLTPNPKVKYDTETTFGTEAYGDEITPANSIFHVVKGAAEFSSAPSDGEGDNVLDATGAIRFSSEIKKTGGQSCNMYSFWKATATNVTYPQNQQESYMVYKGLPMPTVDWGMMDYSLFGHGKFPITDPTVGFHESHGSQDWTLSMKINFKKLEMAYIVGEDATEDTVNHKRGFHVILATGAPKAGETYYDYVYRLSDGGDWNSSGTDVTDHNGVGFSLMNTTTAEGLVTTDSDGEFIGKQHIKVFDLSRSVMSLNADGTGTAPTTGGYVTWGNVHHAELGGSAPDSGGSGYATPTRMEEGEWYDIRVVIPVDGPTKAMLVIDNAEGQNVTAKGDNAEAYFEETASAFRLHDFGATGQTINPNQTPPGMLYGEDADGGDALGSAKWWQHLSIWCTNTKTNYKSSSTTNGTDWMANKEDRDTETNIFIDSLCVYGVNLGHINATVGQEGRTARGRISITGSDTMESSLEPINAAAMHPSYFNKKGSSRSIIRRSDTAILLGFEDPSQISSAHDIEPSWRYLFWNGFSSANLGSDNKITWTAGDSLPATTGIHSARQPAAAGDWFNAINSAASGSTFFYHTTTGHTGLWALGGSDNSAPTTNAPLALYADAGVPIAWTEFQDRFAPSALAFYSDGHHTSGGTFSDEVLNMRNLFMNRTYSIDDSSDVTDTTEGLYGSEQFMASMCPSIGAVVAPNVSTSGGTAISSGVITIENGPFGGNGQYWKTGHPVVYYNNKNTSITNLVSATGNFTDNPSGTSTGKYYIIRTTGTDNRTFKLAATEALAHAQTALTTAPAGTPTGNHIFYDYDYYVNRKYFIDGFTSKGLMKLILQPTNITSWTNATPSTNKAILGDFLDVDESKYIKWDYTDERFETSTAVALGHTISTTEAQLTKRENMACAAKVLEVLVAPNNLNTGSVTLRVDTMEPLYSVVGTKYRLFLVGSSGTGSYKSDVSISIISKETIQIDNWNGEADDASTNMLNVVGDSDVRDTTLSRLWIGPEKYWVGFLIRNQAGYSGATIGTLPNKSYESVCVVSPSGGERPDYTDQGQGQSSLYPAWGTPGATYSESTYSADKVSGIRGAYINNWSPTPHLDPNQTIYDLQDYGYGGPKEDKQSSGVENNVLGGYAASFIPRTGQINKIKIPALFSVGDPKEEGDSIDIAIQAEGANNPSIMSIASIDNNTYPKPFLLTVFEDSLPEPPVDLEVAPKEEDEFLPEFTWTAGDGDLWYGFIIIDDRPINNQYHHSLLHVPLNEDLRTVASSYDNTKGHYYASISNPIIYGHRYENTSAYPTGIHATDALASAGTGAVSAVGVKLYDSEEGLAGNTKMFDNSDGTYAQFNFNTTPGSSDFSYPVDEMSIVVHITPTSWGANRYICAFNEPSDTSTTKDSWGIYLGADGQINAFVSASPGTSHQSNYLVLKSTTKVPVDGTPTAIILTVDTQLHSGNVKLYINGKLEDQTGLRGTLTSDGNNWPTDINSLGGEAIFYDTNGSEDLFIGAKSQNGSVGQNSFEGKIEEFVWYDKCIYPVTPQDGKFTLEKPIKELVTGTASASSKSYTARLFIKDYHNIRGKTSGEVAASSQVSFKKAAFSLYT